MSFLLTVLHDLLRSFRLEWPLSSSRVPPWDLLFVLHFLRGAPFEPLSSCSLRDLTRKVLFLVLLAAARRVDELQALFLSPCLGRTCICRIFRSFSRRLSPQPTIFPGLFASTLYVTLLAVFPMNSCCVQFVRSVSAFRVLLFLRVLILSVSPRSPSRPLSKNALSFFLREVISQASSTTSSSARSAPSPSSSSSGSSRPSSSFRAH